MGYDHHRQCIPYRYYYIYDTAKLFPIGNIYPNIVKSTTDDQIEPEYEAINRHLTGKAYPLPCCRLPGPVLIPTCPYSRFKPPLSPSSPGKGFPRPLPSQKQEAMVPAKPACAERQSLSAIANLHAGGRWSATQQAGMKPSRSLYVRPSELTSEPGLAERGSKGESVLSPGSENVFASQLKNGGILYHIIILLCCTVCGFFRLPSLSAFLPASVLLFLRLFAVILFFSRLFCSDCLYLSGTVPENSAAYNIIIKYIFSGQRVARWS